MDRDFPGSMSAMRSWLRYCRSDVAVSITQARSLPLQLRGPVDYHGDGCHAFADRLAKDKSLGITGNAILALVRIHCHGSLKERVRRAGVQCSSSPHIDRLKFAVQCKIEEFPTVPPPERLATAGNGNLSLPSKRGIRCYVNLIAPRFGGFVGHPASILRNRGHIFKELRLQRQQWFALANERHSIEVVTSSNEKNPPVLRPAKRTLVVLRLVDQFFFASS